MAVLTTGLSVSMEGFLRDEGDLNLVSFTKSRDLVNFLGVNPSESKLVLIGEKKVNPIKLAQKVSAVENDIYIAILVKPELYEAVKEQLLKSAFISKNTNLIRIEDGNGLIDDLNSLIERSIQQQKYAEMSFSIKGYSPAFQIPDKFKREFLGRFLQQAPKGAILLNHDLAVLSVNQSAERILQIQEQDLLTTNFLTIIPEKYHTDFTFFLSNSDKKNQVRVYEFEEKLTTLQYLEFAAAKIDISNSEYFYLLMIDDITNLLVVEQKLMQNVERLKRTNKDLEQFAYIVSHDLKNPLATMKLSCQLAEKDTDLASLKGHVRRLSTATDHVLSILNNLEELVDIAKGENDKAKTIKFQNAFEFVISDYELILKKNKGTVSVDFSNAPDIVYLEAYLISIFSNLISNAVKYRSSDRQLALTVYTKKKENGCVMLVIKDNGIGIDIKQNEHKLFEPYHRFTQSVPGKGIGLSIIKKMIEKNGGAIKVKSKLNEGTEFQCYLREYKD